MKNQNIFDIILPSFSTVEFFFFSNLVSEYRIKSVEYNASLVLFVELWRKFFDNSGIYIWKIYEKEYFRHQIGISLCWLV